LAIQEERRKKNEIIINMPERRRTGKCEIVVVGF
jgi:hypothetical protein